MSTKGKWKIKEKLKKYENYEELDLIGILKNDKNEIEDDKKCEYKYIMKNELSMKNIKLGKLLSLLFALMLM